MFFQNILYFITNNFVRLVYAKNHFNILSLLFENHLHRNEGQCTQTWYINKREHVNS